MSDINDDIHEISTDEAASILGGSESGDDLAALLGTASAIDDTPVEQASAADEAVDVIDVEDLLEEQAPRPKRQSPYDKTGDWFVVHTQSGYEKKVKSNLESRIHSMNMEDSIFEVVIPMEDVIEFKNGKKVVVQKKVFPGYLYVRCFLDEIGRAHV